MDCDVQTVDASASGTRGRRARRHGTVIRPLRRLSGMRRATTPSTAPLLYPNGTPVQQYIAEPTDGDDDGTATTLTSHTLTYEQRYAIGLRFTIWVLNNADKDMFIAAAAAVGVPWNQLDGGWERAAGDTTLARPERIARFLMYLDRSNRPTLLAHIRTLAPPTVAPPASESSANLALMCDFVMWLTAVVDEEFPRVFADAFPQATVGFELKRRVFVLHMDATKKIGWSAFARALSFIGSLPPLAVVHLLNWAVPEHRTAAMAVGVPVVV